MRVFISRLYLIYSRRNSRFPAQIASLLFEGLITRLCMGTSVILSTFSYTVHIHSKTIIFLTVSNNYLTFNPKN